MASESTSLVFSDRVSHALVAYLIVRYKEVSTKTLGRTILQKLCYFAEANGVPLPFRFEIYHYGPFSQEIFDTTQNLLLDQVIEDRSPDSGQSNYFEGPNCKVLLKRFSAEIKKYKKELDVIARMFSELDPSQMELVATVHYFHSSRGHWFNEPPGKEDVVGSVLDVKGTKFSRQLVESTYDLLQKVGLLSEPTQHEN